MIKQDILINTIDTFPRFSIIVGGLGSGKKLFVKELLNKFSMESISFSSGIEDVRRAIELSTQQPSPIVFVFADADKMSVPAKNALLKVTEEPPNNVYFVITLQSLDNTLPTIASRGQVIRLLSYIKEDLLQYRRFKGYDGKFDNFVTEICHTPGEIDELFKLNLVDFFTFVNVIIENIHIPMNGNAFKITKKLKLKDTDEGFEPMLLLKAIQVGYILKAKETKKSQYLRASMETAKSIRELNLATVNKLGSVDMWIMNVRSALRGI